PPALLPAARRASPRHPGALLPGDRAPARVAAHGLRRPRRRALPGDPAAGAASDPAGRPRRPAAGTPGGGGLESRRRRGPPPVRPRARAALADPPGAPRRRRSPAAGDHAPHHLGRLVARRLLPRAVAALHGVPGRAPVAAPGAAGAVSRLRALAARPAPGRAAGGGDPLLARAAR